MLQCMVWLGVGILTYVGVVGYVARKNPVFHPQFAIASLSFFQRLRPVCDRKKITNHFAFCLFFILYVRSITTKKYIIGFFSSFENHKCKVFFPFGLIKCIFFFIYIYWFSGMKRRELLILLILKVEIQALKGWNFCYLLLLRMQYFLFASTRPILPSLLLTHPSTPARTHSLP